MSASSYGIIVEGPYDSLVYESIISRLVPETVHIKSLSCEGKTNLMDKFPKLLRALEYELAGNPVEMAVVIRDANGKEAGLVEDEMRSKIADRHYGFPLGVRCYAVAQAMDAWLLADVNAVNAAVQRRQGRRVKKSHDAPESLPKPKEWFRWLLTDHNATCTPKLCREIAEEIDLGVLSQRCPRFRVFSELVDC